MNSQPRTTNQRIEELEVLFTHLQRTVQDLDDVVVAQAKCIDVLEREVKSLAADLRMQRDASREPRRLEDDIPPHY